VRTTLPALALALAACSSTDDRGAPAASSASLGPDAIVLRMPASGGQARAYRYPALDTLLWTTRAALPAQVQPLAFSIDAGVLAFRDSAGVAWRLTLGSGLLERAYPTSLDDVVSLDGTTVYGTRDGALLRLTTTESTPWKASTAARQSQLQPLRDGGVLLIGQRPPETVLTRFRPPSSVPVDSAVLPGPARLISAAGGDRYYLSDGPRGLVSVRARDLQTLGTIALGDSIIATTSSPSGDRVYVLGQDDGEARVQVIAKYTDEIIAKIDVPSDARDLRMDPLGRYVLVRTGGAADSVLVIGVATNAVLGRIVSPWRADLPLVLPDGRLATLRGEDVLVLSADRFQAVSVVALGARDIWTVVQWNGFRRRSDDGPMRATAARVDTTTRRVADTPSATRARPPQAATPPAAPATLGDRGTFVVQFAALKAEQPARRLAASIKANGEKAHVVVTPSNGISLYRVILGPFRSRADAEAAGRASARDYWVFEGGTN
jgi:hypothetical protein